MHNRHSIRLRDYDYAQNGAYFVTICTHERKRIFGQVVDGEMDMNTRGQIVLEEWEQTGIIRPKVVLDAFIVMPNHVHGIIVIVDDGADMVYPGDRDHRRGMAYPGDGIHCRGMARHAPTTHHDAAKREFSRPIARSLPTIVGAFKSAVTKRINRLRDAPDYPIWQRNYYEHIIRNEESLNTIRAYIATNPAQWAQDSLFVE